LQPATAICGLTRWGQPDLPSAGRLPATLGDLGLCFLRIDSSPRISIRWGIVNQSVEMAPRDGFSVAHFLTVADIDRSLRFYETVFGGRALSRGDSMGAPGYIQIANTWLLVNVGGGPTPDKPSVTLSVLADPDKISSFMNIRVADIQACYKLWKSRGAEFFTEPTPKYGETRCLHPRS
jgi:predicted enzyme related to lactoylglutathione lyase